MSTTPGPVPMSMPVTLYRITTRDGALHTDANAEAIASLDPDTQLAIVGLLDLMRHALLSNLTEGLA